METSDELRAMFGRHMQAFLREANVLGDLEKTMAALRTVFPGGGDEHKATGLGAVIANQWEALMPTLLLMCDSEERKEQLMKVVLRLIEQQIVEISEHSVARLD